MKVIAQTAALQEALALTGSIVATRTPKPILRCIKLTAAEGTLTLMTTDLESGCRYRISAVEIEAEGEALVPADRLGGIVRESTSDESLTFETEKQTVHVRGAGSHFKIFGYDPGEYPAVAEFPEEGDFQISSAVLAKMISKTLFAAAKAHSHYAISGVLWEAKAKKLQLTATDGHRLAQAVGTLNKATKNEVTAIVPAKLMSLIQRISADADEPLEVKVRENHILVRSARAVLVSSLVQGNFPKYTDVIPKECVRKASINTSQFEHRIRQAALLTNEESKGIRLSFQPDQVTLSARAPETGEAEVNCPTQYEGEPIEIAFNPLFLTEALRVTETDEITFGMNEASKPAMIKSGSDFLYVIMPVELG